MVDMSYLLELLDKARRYINNDTTSAKAHLRMAHVEAVEKEGYIKDKAERARFGAAYALIYEACEKEKSLATAVLGAYDFWCGYAAGQARRVISGKESEAFKEGYQRAQDTTQRP